MKNLFVNAIFGKLEKENEITAILLGVALMFLYTTYATHTQAF